MKICIQIKEGNFLSIQDLEKFLSACKSIGSKSLLALYVIEDSEGDSAIELIASKE